MNDIWANLAPVIAARHCKRAFLDRPVPDGVLTRVLEAAAGAPSTRNNQPWRVEVVSGGARDELVRALVGAFDEGEPSQPDYANRPATPDPVTAQRAAVASNGVLRAKGYDSTNPDERRRHLRDNLGIYGAPVAMIFHISEALVPGAFLEVGLFLQLVMLGLVAHDLGSCPQFSVAGYPHILRRQLGLSSDRLIVCNLAVGYPDPDVAVNRFVPPRAPAAEFVGWHHQARLHTSDKRPDRARGR